ncbi:MAG TPA: endo-1,4-beta-xylanase [Terriglobales bacterium]|nr:endo-1,4-beta-xylanase [Terriglobales bacterium]
MIRRYGLVLTIGMLLSIAGIAAEKKTSNQETLRQYADKLNFRIGSGIRPKTWAENAKGQQILAREFNSTLTMGMMGVNEPERGRFDFSRMDTLMQFAKEHQMKIWGSALIYRADSLPQWMQDQMHSGPPRRSFSESELEQLMRTHIQSLIRHGGDSFYAWGVVNEPLSGHNQPWQLILGEEDYIAKAFKFAREATSLPLVLNETFGHKGIDKERADEFFALVKRLKSKAVPIDGVGTEMHLEMQQLDSDYLEQFKEFLRRARELKVSVYITEMDVYQGPAGAVANAFEVQKKVYHDVAAACLADSNCKALTVWDLSDKDTWLSHKQRNALTDPKPDLFDEDFEKKPAYYGVLEALKERAARN